MREAGGGDESGVQDVRAVRILVAGVANPPRLP